jgi:hypothetical protein
MLSAGAIDKYVKGKSGGGMRLTLTAYDSYKKGYVTAEYLLLFAGYSISFPYNPGSISGGTITVYSSGLFGANPYWLMGPVNIVSKSLCFFPMKKTLLQYNRNWSGITMGAGWGMVNSFAGDVVWGYDIGLDWFTGVSIMITKPVFFKSSR